MEIKKGKYMISISRQVFLENRVKNLASWEEAKKEFGDCVIIVDAGDEIICDFCNDLIDDDTIRLLDTGSHVLCPKCVAEH
jgi:hypothetical protein